MGECSYMTDYSPSSRVLRGFIQSTELRDLTASGEPHFGGICDATPKLSVELAQPGSLQEDEDKRGDPDFEVEREMTITASLFDVLGFSVVRTVTLFDEVEMRIRVVDPEALSECGSSPVLGN
ncbi:hypothetical protein EI94DRAFT_1708292 [Lactarius quietus]|nr:hypothetical protein EI94DRAFT_1708292 [Lactarius quietus]